MLFDFLKQETNMQLFNVGEKGIVNAIGAKSAPDDGKVGLWWKSKDKKW